MPRGGTTQVSFAETRIDVLRNVVLNLTALSLGPGLSVKMSPS